MNASVGKPDGKAGCVLNNWASTYSCSPELYFEPRNIRDIRQILALARVEKKCVRVIGSGCSPSDIQFSDDYLISMKHLNRVVDIDHDAMTAIVEGGITLRDLNEALDKNGLALSILPALSEFTLVGAISTGTHSSGMNFGGLHTYVREIELMCADGSIKLLSPDVEGDVFQAACVSLGALGVILSVKIQCEAAFTLHLVTYGAHIKDVIENLEVHMSSSDHFKYLLVPHTDHGIVCHANRTNRPVKRLPKSWFWDYFISCLILEFLYWLGSFIPSVVSWTNRTYYKYVFSARSEIVDLSDRVFNFNCYFSQYVSEWAIPVDHAGIVLSELNTWIENNFHAHFYIEVRFAKRDTAFLSLAFQRDVCFINIVSYRPYGKSVEHKPYWNKLQELALKVGGRPHWAKDHAMTAEDFRVMYPCWDKFVEIRNRLDPEHLFTNRYLAQVLGETSLQSPT